MRICVDLDGVICELRRPDQSYADVGPRPGAVEALSRLRAAGNEIIIHTARHMRTTGGNVGRVVALQGETTLAWLRHHGIEYDEIHFGKPHADIYIDDNALRFESWDLIRNQADLPMSAERRMEERQ